MSKIFLFDVFVSHLRLSPEIVKDAGRTTFIVKVNFNNFPQINLEENNTAPKILPDNSVDYLFYKGQMHYFSMKISDLVEIMKKKPLRIGIYRVGDSFPLCEVIIPVFGCACSLVSNDCEEELPRVLTIDGPFNLLDPGKKLSGQIYINVAFVNYGRFINSNYFPQKNSFLFKTSPEGSEYECFQISTPECLTENSKIDPRNSITIPEIDWSCKFPEVIDNFITDLIAIIPCAKQLLIEKPSLTTPHIAPKETESSKEKEEKTKKISRKQKK